MAKVVTDFVLRRVYLAALAIEGLAFRLGFMGRRYPVFSDVSSLLFSWQRTIKHWYFER